MTTDPDAVAYPDTLIRVRPDLACLDSEFLDTVWNSRVVRRQIEARVRTTAGIYKVNQKSLGSVLLPVPTLERQREFVAEVTAHNEVTDRTARSVMEARTRSVALRRAVLAAAFSGRLTGASSDSEVIEEAQG